MPAAFHQLEHSHNAAATNMALDQLLLEAYPEPAAIRFRPYGWTDAAAFTFGYSQQFAWVHQQTAAPDAIRIRRTTGGGIVDHRNDWTYALVIPSGHPLHHAKGEDVYRLVHQAVAAALQACGQPALLAGPRPPHTTGIQGLCFAAPECADVIAADSQQKIAGAAMKRNRHGLLMQGSIEKSQAPLIADWAPMANTLAHHLAQALSTHTPQPVPTPQYPADAHKTARQRFSSTAWNEKR